MIHGFMLCYVAKGLQMEVFSVMVYKRLLRRRVDNYLQGGENKQKEENYLIT